MYFDVNSSAVPARRLWIRLRPRVPTIFRYPAVLARSLNGRAGLLESRVTHFCFATRQQRTELSQEAEAVTDRWGTIQAPRNRLLNIRALSLDPSPMLLGFLHSPTTYYHWKDLGDEAKFCSRWSKCHRFCSARKAQPRGESMRRRATRASFAKARHGCDPAAPEPPARLPRPGSPRPPRRAVPFGIHSRCPPP